MSRKTLLSSFLFALLFSFQLFSVEAKTSRLSELDLVGKENKTTYPAPVLSDDSRGPFISSNAGVGFLFDRANSNLKSAVFEAVVGYNLNSIMKLGAAYQYQTPIHVQSTVHEYDYNLGISQARELKYNIQLQSLALKMYFSPEFPLTFNSLMLSPYLSLGVGMSYLELSNANETNQVTRPYRVKKAWTAQALMQGEGGVTFGTKQVSVTTGCRLARYQSFEVRNGFFSVAPYAGLQFNF